MALNAAPLQALPSIERHEFAKKMGQAGAHIVGGYRKICDAVQANDYEGWSFDTESGRLPNPTAWSPAKAIRWDERDKEVAEVSLQFL